MKTVEAKVEEKPESASCTEPGKVTYKASVEFDGKTYEDSKSADVPALGHDYKVSEKDGWKWTADKEKGYTAKATFVCSRCKHSKEVEAEVTPEENDGQVTYKANVTFYICYSDIILAICIFFIRPFIPKLARQMLV